MENKINVSGDFTETELQEIMRNLKTLYETPEGSIPTDRQFGLNQEVLDENIEVAKNDYAVEVIEKTEMYEPRVVVEKVEYEVIKGELVPTIYLKKGET